jgi:hypothetical protein
MLHCWWGSGRALVELRDDGGDGCAIVFLGQQRYWGMRAVVGMGQRARRCRGRRAAVTESTTTTRTADNATREERWTMTPSNKSSHFMTQGNENGGNDGGRDVRLRASYSQHCLLRV